MGRISLILVLISGAAAAQPAPDPQQPAPEPDIEMEPDPAPSDQPATPVKDAKIAAKWVSAGNVLAQKGDYYTRRGKPDDARSSYENALTAYEKAIEASDDVGLNFPLALTLEKLNRGADAFHKLKLVVAPNAVVKPDVAKKAQAKLDELTTKLGSVMLQIVPAGTTISIGGKEVGEAPLTEPLVLDPGTYTVSFAAVGYQPKEAEVKVEAGAEVERKIDLEPIKMVVHKEEDSSYTPDAPQVAKPPSKLPLYIGAGATGGLLLIGIITGIAAVSAHGTYTDPKTTGVDRLDAHDNGTTLAHVTDVMLVGSLAAAGFTAYWYLKKYRPAEKAYMDANAPEGSGDPEVTAKVRVSPWVQTSAGGIVVGGSF